MLFARWQHHLRFCSSFPYAPLKAMVTEISKWSRIKDSFRITPKIESLVVCAIPDIPSKFQKDPSITFWVILLTDRQTDKQTKSGKNITSLVEVNIRSATTLQQYLPLLFFHLNSDYNNNYYWIPQLMQILTRHEKSANHIAESAERILQEALWERVWRGHDEESFHDLTLVQRNWLSVR